MGHPLLGDPLYGDPGRGSDDGFLLHASRIECTDPAAGLRTVDEAPLPAAWEERLARLDQDGRAAERARPGPR